jgi:hypothetical protein
MKHNLYTSCPFRTHSQTTSPLPPIQLPPSPAGLVTCTRRTLRRYPSLCLSTFTISRICLLCVYQQVPPLYCQGLRSHRVVCGHRVIWCWWHWLKKTVVRLFSVGHFQFSLLIECSFLPYNQILPARRRWLRIVTPYLSTCRTPHSHSSSLQLWAGWRRVPRLPCSKIIM